MESCSWWKKLCKLCERKMELIFAFFFQQRLDSKKKMEESQKSKNMRSMCSFQQGNNHRKRIRKFCKTDLSSSPSIVNFVTHTWKMQSTICIQPFFSWLFQQHSVWLTMWPTLISWQRASSSWAGWWDVWCDQCCLHDVDGYLHLCYDDFPTNVMHSIKFHIKWCYFLEILCEIIKFKSIISI